VRRLLLLEFFKRDGKSQSKEETGRRSSYESDKGKIEIVLVLVKARILNAA
jgi:hypothetical protein